MVALAAEVLATLATLPGRPTAARLASALRWTPDRLAFVLAPIERAGLVDRRSDPDRPGGPARLALSARSLRGLGPIQGPRDDRWNPDRPNRPRGAPGPRFPREDPAPPRR